MGQLRITGTLDLQQFWPGGSSDGDTVSIIVDLDGFRYSENGKNNFHLTKVLDEARVRGHAVKNVLTKGRKLTVRLQGIDAPELHYHPAALPATAKATAREAFKAFNQDFRQRLGETAVTKLGLALSAGPGLSSKVVVDTVVSSPDEVFDTYGRCVAELSVKKGTKLLNVNHWMLEHGWAFPTFYNSMTPEEILTMTAMAETGRKHKTALWKNYKDTITAFEPQLVFRGANVPLDEKSDTGSLILPKLFRRQATHWAHAKAGADKGSYWDFIASTSDYFHLADEFVSQGPTAAPIYTLASAFDANHRLKYKPEQLVFREAPSTIIDAEGKKISAWW